MEPKLAREQERFAKLSKKDSFKFYGKRDIAEIPDDVLKIADRARLLQGDVDTLRAQLLRSTVRNAIISGIVAGIITASKFGVVAIIKLLSH
jgi:hypothetical protein